MGGIQLPFFPVWLKAKGLDPGMIGVVLAAPMVVRMIAIPVAARAADRRDALRGDHSGGELVWASPAMRCSAWPTARPRS